MIVLGIDPGYDRLGLAVVEQKNGQLKLLYSDCFTTDKKIVFGARLLALGNKIEKILKDWQPQVVTTEKLYFTVNQKTAMAVAEVRGIIIYLSAQYRLPLVEYTPLEIKTCVTGYGSADKKQIVEMIPRLIKISKIIKHDDEYDAIGIALTYLARASFLMLSTPK